MTTNTNWICDCMPPLPDLKAGDSKICNMCGMKKSDILKRLNRRARFKFCPKCKRICAIETHQDTLYRVSRMIYFIRNKKGIMSLRYTQRGLRLLRNL